MDIKTLGKPLTSKDFRQATQQRSTTIQRDLDDTMERSRQETRLSQIVEKHSYRLNALVADRARQIDTLVAARTL